VVIVKFILLQDQASFTVAAASVNCASENIVSYIVVAGGGGGGYGGGGGAGGFREVKNPLTYTASPLDGSSAPTNAVTVTAQSYPITVVVVVRCNWCFID
jgi:hypothetical protein